MLDQDMKRMSYFYEFLTLSSLLDPCSVSEPSDATSVSEPSDSETAFLFDEKGIGMVESSSNWRTSYLFACE